jgi:hypothetical protein
MDSFFILLQGAVSPPTLSVVEKLRGFIPASSLDRPGKSGLRFHDSTFECVARSFNVETHRTGMKELLGLMIDRLTS